MERRVFLNAASAAVAGSSLAEVPSVLAEETRALPGHVPRFGDAATGSSSAHLESVGNVVEALTDLGLEPVLARAQRSSPGDADDIAFLEARRSPRRSPRR